MKKIIFCLLTTFLVFITIPEPSKAAVDLFKTEVPAVDSTVKKNLIEKIKESKMVERPLAKINDRKSSRRDGDIYIGISVSVLLLIIIILLLLIVF